MIKFKILLTLIFSNKFMVVTGSGKDLHFVTTYTDSEIVRSGNAIYIK